MKQNKVFRFLMMLLLLVGGRAWAAPRKEAWVEVRSPHFVAYSNAGISEAQKILSEFEEIRSVFRGVFPSIRVDAPKPMILLVLRDEASMKRFVPREFEGKNPKRSSGFYLSCSDRNYALVRLDTPYRAEQPFFVVFHEYTHGILHQNFSAFPTWLDEGIADFYGATEIRTDQVLVGKVPRGRLETMRTSALLPLETLFSANSESPHYREGDKSGVFYSQSWALVHYLFMDERAQKAGLFKKYLKALQENTDPAAAAKAGFGDLEALQSALSAYARQPMFNYWRYKLSMKLTNRDFKSVDLSEAEALVVEADFLQNSGREKDAQHLLQQALALNPKLPGVHAALGLGHFLRQDRPQAIASFEEAMRLGGDDFRPPYYLARLAQDQGSDSPEESAKVFGHLESARRLSPDFPGIHMLLCREYSKDPKQGAKALEEGRRAVELDLQNLSNRANFGYACMRLDLALQAELIGSQLNQLARNPMEKLQSEQYAVELKRFLDRRAARAAEPLAAVSEGRSPIEPTGQGQSAGSGSLKFRLPESLAPLGREVLRLMAEGKSQEAVQKVEAELSRTKKAWERKSLEAMLEQLKAKR